MGRKNAQSKTITAIIDGRRVILQPPAPIHPFDRFREWTEKENKLLSKYYPKYGAKYCAVLLGRTVCSIQRRVYRLHLRFNGVRVWTAVEVRYLRMAIGKRTIDHIAHTLNRRISGVKGQIRWLRLLPRKREYWSLKETEFMRKHYGKMPAVEIASKLNRTLAAVSCMGPILGLGKRVPAYSQEEKKYIRNNRAKKTVKQIAKELNRYPSAITVYLGKIGMRKRPLYRPWTDKDTATLRALAGKKKWEDIAKKLNRTAIAVKGRAVKLKLLSAPPRWTPEEDAQLLKLAKHTSSRELAVIFGRTQVGIRYRLRVVRDGKKY